MVLCDINHRKVIVKEVAMRPKIEGVGSVQVIEMVNNTYHDMTPTQLITMLIDKHYNELYPRGESHNGNTEETQEASNT